MKHRIAASLLALFLFATPVTAFAQETKVQQRQNVDRLDSKLSGHTMRASKLIGMSLQNANRDTVGTIRDIVLDPMSGQVHYLAISYGGFLGLGDKWFAVPIEAVKVVADPSSANRVVMQLDVTKEQMQGAQGFDEEHWPNFADDTFTTDLYRRYRVERRWNRDRTREGDVDVNVDRGGVKVQVDGKK